MNKAREEKQLQHAPDKPVENNDDLNRILATVSHSSPEIQFPNYLLELRSLGGDKDSLLIEGYMQSVLARLSLPHYHNNQLTNEAFFEHLSTYAAELIKSKDPELELDLYIGGGVVRALLENLYKFIHDRKTQQQAIGKPIAMDEAEYKKPFYDPSPQSPEKDPEQEDKNKKTIQLQISRKDVLFKSSEYHLKQAALAEKEKLLGPFVLGVGSDLDIYYEARTKTGAPLNDQQKAVIVELKQNLFEYINKAEKEYALRFAQGAIKHSILPVADVKEYQAQVTHSLQQGGSLLDSLAFKIKSFEDHLQQSAIDIYHLVQVAPFYQTIVLAFFHINLNAPAVDVSVEQIKVAMVSQLKGNRSHQNLERLLANLDQQIEEANLAQPVMSLLAQHKKNRRSAQLRLPEGHPDVLKDYLEGVFEYLAPMAQGEKASQKQTIRGLRALVSAPFINVKDERILVGELTNILKDIEDGGTLDNKAKDQFDKLVRNAYHQLGGNRPYKAAEGTALNLGLKIAEAIFKKGTGLNEKVRFLLPTFIQNLPLDKRDPVEIKKTVAHFDELQSYLTPYDVFIKEHTEHGTVYHGTSAEAGICVLRGGFIESSAKQGTASFGPALYATNDLREALKYGASGLVLPLRIASGNMNILDWKKVPADLKNALEEEKNQGKYEHVFEMLRDRKKYAVDIILDTHVLIQNQRVIDLNESLESVFDLVATTALGDLQQYQLAKETEQIQAMQKLMNSATNYHNYTLLFTDLKVKVTTTAMNSQALLAEMMKCPPTVGLFAAVKINAEELIKQFYSLLEEQMAAGKVPPSLLDVTDEFGNTFLRILVRSQKIIEKGIYNSLFRLYLLAGANINAVGSDGRTVFQLFFYLNCCDSYNSIPWRELSALDLFIKAGADLNLRDPISERTPLMTAVKNRDELLVSILVVAKADTTTTDNRTGDTPLHVAVNERDSAIVRSLLAAETIDVNAKNNRLRTALHDAVSFRSAELVTNLLNLNGNDYADARVADVDIETGEGETALDIAIHESDEEIADLLIAAGTDVNRLDRNGCSVLAKAVEEGMTKTVISLLNKADVNKKNRQGDTPLHIAVSKGREEITKLLAWKANINQKNGSGDTPLIIAVHEGLEAIVRVLVKAKADVNETNNFGDSALCIAVTKRHEQIVSLLISKSRVDEPLLERLFSLSLYDSKQFSENILRSILNAGLKIDHKHLSKAVHLNNEPAIHFLLNAICSAEMINQVLVEIAVLPDIETFELILENATDINAIFKNTTALIQAVSANSIAHVHRLINRGVNIDLCCEGCNALSLAVTNGNKEMVLILLASNANREQAIKIAITSSNEDMLHLLLTKYSGRPLNHFTSLRQFLVQTGNDKHLSIMRFINPYIDFNCLDYIDNKTPLMQLCKNVSNQAFDLVLELNPNIDLDVFDNRGMTVLMYALQAQDKNKVLSLLNHDPNPNLSIVNKYHQTALQVADQYFSHDAEVMNLLRSINEEQQRKGQATNP